MSAPGFTESGDSADLQALFDSISANVVPPPPPPPAASAAIDPAGDSQELQALFDSVAVQVRAEVESGSAAAEHEGTDVYNRVGSLARQLHDSIRGLGYDQVLEDAAAQIPDAQQRLTYIAQLTEKAAMRVLTATEVA